MPDLTSTRTRSDLIIVGLVVLASLIILANAAVATTVSVKFLGWILFTVGVVLLVGALVSIGKDGFWGAAIGGGLATALGVGFLRNTERGAVTLTLIVGMMFLFSGLARLAIAYQLPVARVPMIRPRKLSEASKRLNSTTRPRSVAMPPLISIGTRATGSW